MRAQLEEAMQAVFNYDRWDQVAAHFDAPSLDPAAGVKDTGEAIPLPVIPAQMAGESAEHKALKRWVAAHPEEFEDYGDFEAGKNEEILSSGDRLDVLFDNGKQRVAVEVKTSRCSEDELKRGVFQAVKYRAVLRAMQQSENLVPNGEAVLVCTRKPSPDTQSLILRLSVRFQLAPLTAEL